MNNIIRKYRFKLKTLLLSDNEIGSYFYFQKALYLFLLLYIFHLIPILNIITGENSIIPSIANKNLNFDLFSSLNSNWKLYLFLTVYLTLLVKGIYKHPNLFESIFIYIFSFSFFSGTYLLNNGAQQLIIQLLFYIIFSSVSRKNQNSTMISNLGIIACKTQVIIVCFFSGFYKLFGSSWINGSGLFYSLKIKDYNPIWITSQLQENNFFLECLNYISVLYMLLFGFLVIFRLKKILWLGVTIHLSITLIMGIYDFGLVMLISYILFIPKKIL